MLRIHQAIDTESIVAGERTDKDPIDERARQDATGEFFSVGAPLHAVRASYIKRRADDLLYDMVMSGRYAHVLAPDRSGKTSLIAATAARLESSGCKVAILDLEQLGVRDGGMDSGRWYYSVAYRLLRQLRIRFDLQSWWQDKSILSNSQRLVDFYSEVILQHVPERIVVFVDEIQCIEDLAFADQLLASIRAAHNARTTDPDFLRLSFVLLGECDPLNLIEEAELSPFNITKQVSLEDFSRANLDLFSTELNLQAADAAVALDRIYHWTNGQPYLSQKLARAVAKETPDGSIDDHVDRIALSQLAGRAALHSEPQMSHIHRAIVNDNVRREPILNLYGKIRKGISVPADLGSALQRRLIAVGLLKISEDSDLKVRNRLYETVFTARWANENLPIHFKVPAAIIGLLLLFAMIPFWYTQWLPGSYVEILTSDTVTLQNASTTYKNFRSFPGHASAADNYYRRFLERRALASINEEQIQQLATLAAALPNAGRLAEQIEAGYWDRKASNATRLENRDAALIANIQSLVLSTALRRQRAAALVSDDYPLLLTTLSELAMGTTVFDPVGMVLTTADGAQISQILYTAQGTQSREPWPITALEVSPLVRRVFVDRQGIVSRIGLTLNISHARLSDLRIKIVAPSGRAVEIETGLERASSNDDIRISASQLSKLLGESLSGTWSISVRDERLGIAGQLVGWNLKLNVQGAVEYFQRGLNIPDPVERETDKLWFDKSGRYAVARATQSDSARIWDLASAEPMRAIALNENEVLIGLDAPARRLVTATQGSVNLWDTASGDKVATLAVGAASMSATLTRNGTRLFVVHRGDIETRLELWGLDDGLITAQLTVAGVPALVAINPAGSRVAIADFDRAVRVWDLGTADLLGEIDLPAQPGAISLSADGSTLGAVSPDIGLSLWSIERPQRPLLALSGNGNWQLAFSPSGNLVAAGRPQTGFGIFSSHDGRLTGPVLGVRNHGEAHDLLSFSQDERLLLTGSSDSGPRIWHIPIRSTNARNGVQSAQHTIWSPSADSPVVVSPDGSLIVIGDASGHVHVLSSDAGLDEVERLSTEVSFIGHTSDVRLLSVDPSGLFAASVATNNTLRIWTLSNGEPLPYVVGVSGAPVSQIHFSPDASRLAFSNGNRVSVLNVSDGVVVAQFEMASDANGLAFATDDRLYAGGEDGALQLISQSANDNWQRQQVWQGPESIKLLRASPRGNYLIVVDRNNLATQFVLSEGRTGDAALQLPSDVYAVVFDANGTRAYFQTPRWVHRASSSNSGLLWIDALFVPNSLRGAGIVYGNGTAQSNARNRVYLPAARNSYIELVELNFTKSASPAATGLFGNREELLHEWRGRISAVPHEGS